MESELFKIDKLEEANQWTTWKFQIRITLQSNEVFEVVNGEEKAPEVEVEDYDKKLAAWKKKEYKAQRIITATLSRKLTIHVLNCKSSKEMWEKLHSVFEQKGETSKHLLQQKFFSFEKDPNDDMATHISKLEEIVNQLKDLEVNIDESMVITKILMTLPNEYHHFNSAWESTAIADQTLIKLTSRLMNEENRFPLRTRNFDHSAIAYQVNRYRTTNKRDNKDSERKPGKCYKCNGTGHWKKDCMAQIAQNSMEDEENTDNQVAFISDVTQNSIKSEEWTLDSATSRHMCFKKEWFNDFVTLKQPIPITIGNGEKMYAHGRGNINIKSFDGEKWIKANILDVLYVPMLYKNLFSSICAMDKGHTLYSDNKKCELRKKGNLVAIGIRKDKLF